MNLTEYQSHKRVRAGRIVGFDDGILDVVQADGTVFKHVAHEKLFARGHANIGDYLVQYDDGYVSWSPAKAFEDGYRALPQPQANVFAGGQGDARQSDAPTLVPEFSLFRKRYRKLEPDEVALHDAIKDKADELAFLFQQVRHRKGKHDAEGTLQSPDIDRAIAHLEDAVYRAVKALTA